MDHRDPNASRRPALYRVCWRSSLTGATGHGEPLPKEIADAWVKEMNAKLPDIEHRVEWYS